MKVVQQLTCLYITPSRWPGLFDRWAVEHAPDMLLSLVFIARDGVLEDCPRARGPKIVALALASNSSGLGLGF